LKFFVEQERKGGKPEGWLHTTARKQTPIVIVKLLRGRGGKNVSGYWERKKVEAVYYEQEESRILEKEEKELILLRGTHLGGRNGKEERGEETGRYLAGGIRKRFPWRGGGANEGDRTDSR